MLVRDEGGGGGGWVDNFAEQVRDRWTKQGFHLQGNFLAEGNLDTCKENCKEIRLTRKWQGYFDVHEEIRRKLDYF